MSYACVLQNVANNVYHWLVRRKWSARLPSGPLGGAVSCDQIIRDLSSHLTLETPTWLLWVRIYGTSGKAACWLQRYLGCRLPACSAQCFSPPANPRVSRYAGFPENPVTRFHSTLARAPRAAGAYPLTKNPQTRTR